MVFVEDYPDLTMRGKPKGIRKILEERGFWKRELNLDCQACKNKKLTEESSRPNCCARRIIASQPDFIAQKSAIVELIESAGHTCVFYPKFHCELNFIEMYWGAAKRYTRNYCDYTWTGLQETVPRALDLVDIITIRRFARKSWRYTEYACKKFKSHRRIPQNELVLFRSEANDLLK